MYFVKLQKRKMNLSSLAFSAHRKFHVSFHPQQVCPRIYLDPGAVHFNKALKLSDLYIYSAKNKIKIDIYLKKNQFMNLSFEHSFNTHLP